MWDRLFAQHAPEIRLTRYDVLAGVPLPPPQRHAAWLMTGSRQSVFDGDPWIGRVLEFIRAIHEVGRPFVGICFGHQAIAQALGGETRRAPAGWGIGVHGVDVIGQRPWMQPPAESLSILVSHQDQVAEVPPGGEVLAGNDHCSVWMLQVGPTTLGIQGHPEFVAPYARALMDARAGRIPADTMAEARASLERPTDERVLARWMAAFLSQMATADITAGDDGRTDAERATSFDASAGPRQHASPKPS